MFAIARFERCLRLGGEEYKIEDRLHVIYSTPRDRAIPNRESEHCVASIVAAYADWWRQQPTLFNLHRGGTILI